MRRLFVFVVAMAVCLIARTGQTVSAQDLVILHVNDTHSHIDPERSGECAGMGGSIERAAFADSVRRAVGKKHVLMLHAGDFSQGTSYFTELHGDIEIDLLNAMGYDAVCLGNHEFDNGDEELARRLSSLKCPVLCANYDFSASPLKNYVKPYTIVKKAGKKIGIIGLLTDVTTVVDRSIAEKMNYLDPAETANKYAAFLKEEKGCDMVICLTHLGYEGESYIDPSLVKQTRNIDLVVGGHSHTKLLSAMEFENLDGKKIPIVTDWKWGLYMGCMEIYF